MAERPKYNSIVQALEYHSIHSTKNAYIFLSDGEETEESMTFSQLLEFAKLNAAFISSFLERGDRVILLYPQGLEFVKVFIGCMMAHVISIPTHIPRNRTSLKRIEVILNSSGSKTILTTSKIAGSLLKDFFPKDKVKVVATDNINYPKVKADSFSLNISPDDIAFLQYTSGSVSKPKGVTITHKNIIANQQLIKETFIHDSNSDLVTWLPHFHDMGLIGNILQPLYVGATCIMLSSAHFLQKPQRWLKAISKYKAHTSGAPNFAYQLCVDVIEDSELESCDLSHWKIAYNGSERINIKTLEDFYQKFKKVGFTNSSFLPCYGMAEATLLISGFSKSDIPRSKSFSLDELQLTHTSRNTKMALGRKVDLVSCGEVKGFEIVLINANQEVVKEGEVGEICILGDSLFAGYWEEDNIKLSTNEIYFNNNNRDYFRTGDLGIIEANNLYIAGRSKDIIIIRGINYYPEDIELVVEKSDENVVKNACAAFSLPCENKEKLIIITEAYSKEGFNYSQIKEKIQSNIQDEFELTVDEILFIRRGTIPKTTSGKIQRKLCLKLYLENTLNVIHYSVTTQPVFENETFTTTERFLKAKLESLLKISGVSVDENVFSTKLDSLQSVYFGAQLSRKYNCEFPFRVFNEYPTIRYLSAYIDSIKESTYQEFRKSEKKEYYRTTGLQSSIWFNQSRYLDSNSYNLPFIKRINLKWNEKTFIKLLNIVFAEDSVFNTQFKIVNGELVQTFNHYCKAKYDIFHYHANEKYSLKDFIESHIRDLSVKSFDLLSWPLYRIAIIRTDQDEFYILLTFHHIIVDFHSILQIFKQLGSVYSGLLDTRKLTSLRKHDVNFNDYAEWIQHSALKETNSYWENLLKDLQPTNLFPNGFINTDLDRAGKSIFFTIEKSLMDKIQGKVSLLNINLFSFLIGGYILLIQSLLGEDDVVVGFPSSTRNREGLWSILGLFINTLVLRTGDTTKSGTNDYLRRIYHESRKGLENLDYDYGTLIRDSGVNIKNSHLAITPYFFNYLSIPDEEDINDFFEAYASNLGLDLNYYINLYALPCENQVKFRLDYRECLFTDNLIHAVTIHYKELLLKLAQFNTESVLQFRRGEELKNTVYPDNKYKDIEDDYLDLSVVNVWGKNIKTFSNRIAVTVDDEKYTYGFIDSLANKTANLIDRIQGGARKGQTVGIFLEHGVHTLYSILAILKTGGVYVPLDTAYPLSRLKQIIHDANIDLLISSGELDEKVQELNTLIGHNVKLLFIDELENESENYKNNLRKLCKDNAYCLYTSGSTGVPKGVIQSHQYILQMVQSFTRCLHISSADKITLIPSFIFSASVMDMFVALLNGAGLHLYDIKSLPSQKIVELICKEKVTIYHSVPTIFRSLFKDVETKYIPLQGIRLAYLAGEPLYKKDFDLYKAKFGDDCLLVNGLGCSEFNICRQYFMNKKSKLNTDIVPLGYSCQYVDIEIVDENQNLLSCGKEGEILLKSKYLPQGYLNSPELTHEKFKNNNNVITYRTGDYGKILLDGSLLYFGRKDNQIKKHGVRIELSEIESVLVSYPGIDEGVVVLNKKNILAAYYRSDTRIEDDKLKSYFSGLLPAVMIPNVFVKLDKFILTHNGKIDRYLLSQKSITENRKQFRLNDLNELGLEIADIWRKVLDINDMQLTDYDDFFGLGGHSLHVLELIAIIKNKLGITILFSDIFMHSTLGSFVKFVQTQKKQINSIAKNQVKEFNPLSSAQIRFYFQHQVYFNQTANNLNYLLKLKVEISPERVEEIFSNILLKRHVALRTSFHYSVESQEPYQIINENLKLPIINLQINDSDIVSFVKTLVKPFELNKAPLFRLYYITDHDHNIYMFFDIHHIIVDGVSINLILNEITLILDGHLLEESDVQFTDYSLYTNSIQYKKSIISPLKEFWVNQFSDEIPALNLPTDFSRGLTTNPNISIYNFDVPQDVIHELVLIAKREGVTLYLILLSAFYFLLSRLSNQSSVIIGIPVSNRTDVAYKNTVGLFINTIPILLDHNLKHSGISLLKEINGKLIDGIDHSEYPFEEIIKMVKTNREINRNPLFDVMFNMNYIEQVPDSSYEKMFELVELNRNTTILDLSLDVKKIKDDFLFTFEFDNSLFKKSSIQVYANLFVKIITAFANNPNLSPGDIDLFEKEEKLNLLNRINGSEVDIDSKYSIYDILIQDLKFYSGKISLEDSLVQLSKGELVNQTNLLSETLMSNGIQQNEIVAIYMDRDVDMIISIFSILAVGALFLPLDPEYPDERISYILKDSNCNLVLTNMDEIGSIVTFSEKNIIHVDKIEKRGVVKTISHRYANLAYLIYTSGSTGKPKGVLVKHKNLVNFYHGIKQVLNLSSRDKILSTTTVSFDIFILEAIIATLLNSTVVIGGVKEQKDVQQLQQTVLKRSINVIQLTPSRLNLILESNYQLKSFFNILNLMLVGGEEFANQIYEKLINLYSGRLYNMYGPTETTIWSSVKELFVDSYINIGKPIANTLMFVIRDENKLQPAGIPGELYIGGEGVAQGYLNMVEHTNERFVPSPLNKEQVVFKSGDLCKYDDNFELQFLGRIDSQIKIHGYRIECKEIEYLLCQNEHIDEAVVIAKKDNLDSYLAAYLKFKTDIPVGQMRNYLLQFLPSYMVPSYYYKVSFIPLLISGKIDYKKLLEISTLVKTNEEYRLPRNQVEMEIHNIWKQVLNREEVSTVDNFFDLGGDSFKLLQLQNKISSSIGKELPILELFRYPTISSFVDGLNKSFSQENNTIESRKEELKIGKSRLDKRLSNRLKTR